MLTLSEEQLAGWAAAHENARRTCVPIDPPSRSHPEMTLDDAYAIQRAWVDAQVASGARVVGHKVGLTSRAMQEAMRIDEPDFGALLDHMLMASGASIRAADHLDPKIEVELAFVLGADISSPTTTRADVLAATDHVVPALELIDARSYRVHPSDGRARTVQDTISDNAANCGVVVGDVRADAADVDLPWVGAVLARNGIVEETGLAAGVLGDPVEGVVWLARRLAGHGIPLLAGQLILSGSFTRPLDCRPGDRFVADYRDLGTITFGVD